MEDGDTKEDEKTDKPQYDPNNWLYFINTYSETTKCSWDAVWSKPITVFFNVIRFSIQKAKRQEQAVNKWKQTH